MNSSTAASSLSVASGPRSDPLGATDAPARAQNGVRVAIAGCGYWGSKHVRVLHGVEGVSGISLIDPDQDLCARLKQTFPAVQVFEHLQDTLPHVDAVLVATPPHTHAAVALQAIRAGKHVLLEKPLATSLSAARQIVGEASRAGVTLMVGHTFCFVPAVRELKRRLARGEFGDIYYIHSARLALGPYRTDVNVVWDLAPHDISILNYLFDSAPFAVTAWGGSLAFQGGEDVAYLRLDYAKPEVAGYAHLSWIDPRKTRTVTVVGSKKMAVYDDLATEPLRIYDRGLEWCEDQPPSHERPPLYRYGDIIAPHIRPDEPLALQDRHFIDCIRSGVVPETSGSDALAVVAALEAIDRSLRSRTTVPVEPAEELTACMA
jgi:predicted dehydrogenase